MSAPRSESADKSASDKPVAHHPIGHDHFGIIAGISYGICFVLFLLGMLMSFWQKESFGSTLWVLILFAIPFIAQGLGLFKVYHKHLTSFSYFSYYYLLTMMLCLFTYCISWLVYSTSLQTYEAFSWVALGFIVILTVLAMRMTLAIIKTPPKPVDTTLRNWRLLWDLNHLSSGVSEKKPLALVFFFTVFLSVSYLFAFALAFHDKAQEKGKHALYMRNLDASEDQRTGVASTNSHPNSSEPAFQLTDLSLKCMANEGVAAPLVAKLAILRNTPFYSKEAFETSLREQCRDMEIEKHITAIREHADQQHRNEPAFQLSEQSLKCLEYEGIPDEIVEGLKKLKDAPFHKADAFKVSLKEQCRNKELENHIPAIMEYASKQHRNDFVFQFDTGKSIPHIENKDGVRIVNSPPELASRQTIGGQNFDSLKAIVGTIKETLKNNGRIRVSIVGHASEKPTKGFSYQSNYEIGEARAKRIQEAIQKKLELEGDIRWKDIIWETSSWSNDPRIRMLRDVNTNGNSINDNKAIGKLARVSIHPFKEKDGEPPFTDLQLIDYVYFANYTITTTGYGDIIPYTPYAKFICSLANIFEVFFLVVLFNALLSLKSGPQQRDEDPAKNDDDKETQQQKGKLAGDKPRQTAANLRIDVSTD
jgi:hypothetical protein